MDPLVLARECVDKGDLRAAAGAYDRAYARGSEVAAERREVLDQLAVVEHGLRFRYIPAGTFLMGSERGEPDERPVHPVTLGEFWLAEIPMTWSAYCELMDWQPPPRSQPLEPPEPTPGSRVHPVLVLNEHNKIRRQYCRDETRVALDVHPGLPDEAVPWFDELKAQGKLPAYADARRPGQYDTKPMVSVGWQDALELGTRLSTPDVHYGLPTEAEWEKAARGGLVGRRYPWGDEAPSADRCDFDQLGRFAIRPPHDLPPNGYGLHGMCGTVWEWTSDWYDAGYYAESGPRNPAGPANGEERVLRGGSWTDCAEAVTVSFRMSRRSHSWRVAPWGDHAAPNIGFRLCRREST
jgi:formylglycine-generating enzyme required for sulfatase activity